MMTKFEIDENQKPTSLQIKVAPKRSVKKA